MSDIVYHQDFHHVCIDVRTCVQHTLLWVTFSFFTSHTFVRVYIQELNEKFSFILCVRVGKSDKFAGKLMQHRLGEIWNCWWRYSNAKGIFLFQRFWQWFEMKMLLSLIILENFFSSSQTLIEVALFLRNSLEKTPKFDSWKILKHLHKDIWEVWVGSFPW